MRKSIFFIFMLLIAFTTLNAIEETSESQIFTQDPQQADRESQNQRPVASIPISQPKAPFYAFTGKVTKNKVRERLQPNLDSAIIRELNANDLVMVVGETEEFYAVEPPADLKAYIFRTYVLDGVIEGNHVNVRLEPDLAAPVIAQLNSGDTVKGSVSTLDKKWLEIAMPSSTRLYVSKEYVEKIGDAGMMSALKRRREEVSTILANAKSNSQIELQKPFDQIHLESITQKLNLLISKYQDFPSEVLKAQELLSSIQNAYLSRKVAYMESQNQPLSERTESVLPEISSTAGSKGLNKKMAVWLPAEHAFYEEWKKQNGDISYEDYYRQQAQDAIAIRGIVEPFNRTVKNKPGDYLISSPATHLPIAYIYSTQVNLQDYAGEEITIKAIKRNNNNFAYPAYFVLSVE